MSALRITNGALYTKGLLNKEISDSGLTANEINEIHTVTFDGKPLTSFFRKEDALNELNELLGTKFISVFVPNVRGGPHTGDFNFNGVIILRENHQWLMLSSGGLTIGSIMNL